MHVTSSKWFVPLFAVGLGIVVFAAQWIGGAVSYTHLTLPTTPYV